MIGSFFMASRFIFMRYFSSIKSDEKYNHSDKDVRG